MTWRAQIDDRGVITRYKNADSGEVISASEYDRRLQTQASQFSTHPGHHLPQMTAYPPQGPGAVIGASPVPAIPQVYPEHAMAPAHQYNLPVAGQPPYGLTPAEPPVAGGAPGAGYVFPGTQQAAPLSISANNPLIQPGARMLSPGGSPGHVLPAKQSESNPPTAGQHVQGKNLRMEGIPRQQAAHSSGYRPHGFLDATSIAILLPTLVLLALIIAAAHKKRLFPWQIIRTFNPPSGLMSIRDYEHSFLCPPNLRKHGRLGKRNPNATWSESDGIVLPFGFLARTHLPVTIPLGHMPNKNMFIVAPSGSGKTTLMRAVIKAMLAKPCVVIALEAKANDPNLDERREGFKYSVLPEAHQAGFETLYFNPLDQDSIHWNPLDLDPITFASSIVQDVNSLPPEEQHWAERDHGYIAGLATLLKWGAVMVSGEDEEGRPAGMQALPCNPNGLMRLVNNRRNIVESLRQLKGNPAVDAAELSELTQTLSSIIRTDSEWDKNIQGIRGRLRMFKNPHVLRVTEQSNVDLNSAMHRPTVLIFGAPASMGPDAESLAACFVYQLQQALHTRYGTASVLPLFAFFDEYQTLNLDIAGRLSAIVRGANGGLTVILQNISQISARQSMSQQNETAQSELRTIFSNSAIRVCLHNADETTAKFFSDEIGKHAIIVPGISDHYQAGGFGIFPSNWNRIHSQQVIPRVDADSIKRMEKHHGLVYLAPAGDAQHGELKPFMVDLRGIEEIARLHLLHNVAHRTGPDGGAAPQGAAGGPRPGGPAAPPSAFITGGLGSFLSAAARMPAAAPGAHRPQPTVAPSVSQIPGAAQVPDATQPIYGSSGRQGAHLHQQPGLPAHKPPAQPPLPGVAQSVADARDVSPPAHTCPYCGQFPGKGKFCIECGQLLAAPPAGSGQLPGSQVTDADVALGPQMQASNHLSTVEPAASASQQRQPVTSLIPDPGRFPFNQQGSGIGSKGADSAGPGRQVES